MVKRTLLLWLLLVTPALAADPASELRIALHDAKAHSLPRQARYVTSYALPAELQKSAPVAVNLLLNSFSRSSRIYRVQQVSPTLYRVDMSQFGIPLTTWESLVERDPFWHIRAEVIDPRTNKQRTVITDSGAVDLAAAAELRQLTGSNGALLRLDWWVGQVAASPGYYDWANIPATSDEWYKSLGLNEKAIVALKANRGAAAIRSGVTRQPRRLSRWQGPAGAGWQSYDVFGDDPKKDPFANPGFTAAFDASELIAAKANGLHQFALYDASGKRQDTVPDKLAKDSTDVHGDGVLRAGISCWRCHNKPGENGIKPFGNDVRDLVEKGVDVLDPDPSVADALGGFYLSRKLDRDVVRDREDFKAAVNEATGVDPEPAAKSLADVFDYGVNHDPTPEDALRELGARSLHGLRPSRNGVVLALFAGKSVKRNQFNAAFQEMSVLVQLNKVP